MSIPHLFLEPEKLQGEEVVLRGEKAFYLLNVLRLKRGERVYLMDGEGAYFLAKLLSASKGSASLQIVKREWRERKPPFLEIGVPLLKGNRTETAIRALSQMGVASILPFISERTVVKLDERKKKERQKHWQKQAIEEAELSCSPFYPQIKEIKRFADVLEELGDIPILIAYEHSPGEEGISLYSVPQRVALLTGPEGGFSEREINLARRRSARLVSLGEHILSAEFAPIIFTSLVLFSYRFDTPLRVS